MNAPSAVNAKDIAEYQAKAGRLQRVAGGHKRAMRFFLLLLMTGGATGAVSSIAMFFETWSVLSAFTAIFTTAVFVLMRRIVRNARANAFNRSIANSPGEFTLSDVGVSWRFHNGSEHDLEWQGVQSWTHTPRVAILRHRSGFDFLLPIPADAALADELMRTLEKNLPPPR